MRRILEQLLWRCRAALLRYRFSYRHTGERVCPEVPDANYEAHRQVYRFMAQFVQGREVLDVGCGTGYGSHHLLQSGAARVTGIDYSPQAVAYARRTFPDSRLFFEQMDAGHLVFADASFDVVCSSENIEHLPDPEANAAEMRRVLRRGGILLLGTPNKEISSPDSGKSPNPFHLREFTYAELEGLLRRHFASVHIFENTLESGSETGRRMKAQRRAGGRLGIEAGGRDSVVLEGRRVELGELRNTHSFMALCW
ncbi:MAG: class I SAM-dependent methyltransferase [Bacteroidota bacterium]